MDISGVGVAHTSQRVRTVLCGKFTVSPARPNRIQCGLSVIRLSITTGDRSFDQAHDTCV